MKISLVVCAALALAACGGSSTPKRSSQLPASGATSQTTTASGSATSSTGSAGTPTTGGSAPCVAADLALSFLGGQGATGHGELGFALRNTTASPCHTYGYPGVEFLDKSGAALTTVATHTTQDFFGQAPLARLTVAPQQTVSFRLGVTHGMTSTAACTTAYGLQVIPPDDTATLRVSIPGGAYECGTATVSPLRPGMSAYP